MIRLEISVLGGLTVVGSTTISAGLRVKRRSLALLAIAAASGPAGASRELVISLLWPEAPEDRAGNSLRQSLFTIRRELGEGALSYDGAVLRLDPAQVAVDLWQLRDAMANGNADELASLYGGRFLGEFTISGLGEFERWVETERQRLHHDVLDALETGARQASTRGAVAEAVRCWRRITALDPLSSRHAIELIGALVSAGDRPAALEYAQTYAALVRTQLEMEPDRGVMEWITGLREQQQPEAVIRANASVPTPSPESAATAVEDPSPSETLPAVASKRRRLANGWLPLMRSAIRRRSRPMLLLVGGLGFAVAVTAMLSRNTVRPANGSSSALAVLPFIVHGGDARQGVAIAVLLGNDMDGAGPIRAIPAGAIAALQLPLDRPMLTDQARTVARRLGARLMVTGEAVFSGGAVRLTATLHDVTRSGAIGSTVTLQGDTTELLALVDRTAASLIEGHYRSAEPLLKEALASTRSLDALKAYLTGDAAARRGQYVIALEALRDATEKDSTFALAYYRQSIVAEWAGRDSLSRHALERAIRFADNLGDRDRRLAHAYASWRGGRVEAAREAYEAFLRDYPDDPLGWLHLGELLFQTLPVHGRAGDESRHALERALTLDKNNTDALLYLARLAIMDGRPDDAEKLLARAIPLLERHPPGEMRAFRSFVLGDRLGQKRVTRELGMELRSSLSPRAVVTGTVFGQDPTVIDKFASELRKTASTPAVRGYAWRLSAFAALGQGRWNEARSAVDSAAQSSDVPALEQLGIMMSLPFAPWPTSAITEARERLRAWDPNKNRSGWAHSEGHADIHAQLRLHRIGLLSIRLGERPAARELALEIERIADSPRQRIAGRLLAQSLRAHASAAAGRAQEALLHLEAADWDIAVDYLGESEANDRFLRATLLDKLGRTDEAIGYYTSLGQRGVHEVSYAIPARQRLNALRNPNNALGSASAPGERLPRAPASAAVDVARKGSERRIIG